FLQAVVQDYATQAQQLNKVQGEADFWKRAYEKIIHEKRELREEITDLQGQLVALQEYEPLVVCLIDRDGGVFSEGFLTKGKEGGRDAAARLTILIKQYLDQGSQNNRRISSPDVLCIIYINSQGLSNTLSANNICTPQNFTDFIYGFNQSNPLFTIVDVSFGKEAADAKVRENKLEVIGDSDLFLKKKLMSPPWGSGGIVPQEKTGGYASITKTPEMKPIINNSKFKKKKGFKAAEDTVAANTDVPDLQSSPSLSTAGVPSAPTASTPKLRKLNPQKANCKFAHDYDITDEQLQEYRMKLAGGLCPKLGKDPEVSQHMTSAGAAPGSSADPGGAVDQTASATDGMRDDLRPACDDLYAKQIASFTDVEDAAPEQQLNKVQAELAALKHAYETIVHEKEVLERQLVALQEDNPLVVCLIDGDGAVFAEELLIKGKTGGHDAAAALRELIKEQVDQGSQNNRRISSPEIICTVYINGQGLSKTLSADINDVCTPQNFTDFIYGFNESTPLFTAVDVGSGKEAVDAKLRESLKLYTRLPQTRRIFFGGIHDGGYIHTLNSIRTERNLNKLVMLKGSKKIAPSLQTFIDDNGIKVVSNAELFLKKNLQSAPGTPRSRRPSLISNGTAALARNNSKSKKKKGLKAEEDTVAGNTSALGLETFPPPEAASSANESPKRRKLNLPKVRRPSHIIGPEPLNLTSET
ncbi:hypothetical protein FRB99_008350, partial [Tulasnella sp. 403]